MGGEKGKIDLLLKFFDSQHFDAWVRPAFERRPFLLMPSTSSYWCSKTVSGPHFRS